MGKNKIKNHAFLNRTSKYKVAYLIHLNENSLHKEAHQ